MTLRDALTAVVDEYGYEDVLKELSKMLLEEAAELTKEVDASRTVVVLVENAAEHCSQASMDYYVSTK